MMSTVQKCRCGAPAHPLYGSRCEDCWTYDQGRGNAGLGLSLAATEALESLEARAACGDVLYEMAFGNRDRQAVKQWDDYRKARTFKGPVLG